jgi:hypothetical protein
MDEDLKRSILRNPFVDRLRDLRVDDDACRDLVDALRRLADAWRGAATIDREVASDLYVINQVTRNMLETLRGHGSPDADRVEEMWIEIDARIMDCLAGEGLSADATLGGDPA